MILLVGRGAAILESKDPDYVSKISLNLDTVVGCYRGLRLIRRLRTVYGGRML